jgi:uncharacterized membrane protein YhhN
LQGLGYLVSTVSVVLLGVAAWPKPGDPPEKLWLILAGMVTSIAGMFLRFLAHRKQKREVSEARAAAEAPTQAPVQA